MSQVHYRTEKEIILEQLWAIVNRSTALDDAGCDWFTVGSDTYIGDMSWPVSSDPELACVVNAINSLRGYPSLIYTQVEDVPEHLLAKDNNPLDDLKEF